MDIRGIRESHLHSILQNIRATFKETARKNLLCSHSGGNVHDDVKKEVLEMRNKLDFCSGTDSPKRIVRASYSNSPSISFATDLENNGTEENVEWMWKECFASNVFGALKHGTLRRQQLLEICNCCHSLFSWEENHCPSCHRTYSSSKETFNFAEHVAECKKKQSEEFDDVLFNLSLPPRIRLLKVQLATIEVRCRFLRKNSLLYP